jgi:hypothetical protein
MSCVGAPVVIVGSRAQRISCGVNGLLGLVLVGLVGVQYLFGLGSPPPSAGDAATLAGFGAFFGLVFGPRTFGRIEADASGIRSRTLRPRFLPRADIASVAVGETGVFGRDRWLCLQVRLVDGRTKSLGAVVYLRSERNREFLQQKANEVVEALGLQVDAERR